MFSYYGSKGKVVQLYPKPKFDTIIEPFAGSARYSLRFFENNIILVDAYKVIVDLWNYLIAAPAKDIRKLPNLPAGSRFKIEDFDCPGQYYLFGYLCNQGAAYARSQVSTRGSERFEYNKKNVINNLHKIRHWKVFHSDYKDISNLEATWFIDAPYQEGGHKYKHNKINYSELKKFILSRKGQVIACENMNAKWMNFTPMISMQGMKKKTVEALYSNYPTAFDNKQAKFKF
ncbi:hypothetical protein [Aureispira sp. CCB-QB1]|uniref:hypothetical protein n=1 Tax=Aureispira sp. CCB-QB1 TaxID=1313421 RepID=UPI0006963815|nr:hypothetical protein [Aureispira sp. CCB-QB1]